MLLRVVNHFYRSSWEFWLLIPAIAGLFWVAGNTITTQVLTRPYTSVNTLQADTSIETNLSEMILTINAVIDPGKRVTTVSVRTANSNAANLTYQFPVVETSQLEAAIAQELQVPLDVVRRLASYRIQD